MPAILRLVVLHEFISVNREEISLRCVTLRVSAGAERVLIEVLDECNGLPGSKVSDLLARSNSEALIERALASASHSAGGAQTRTRPHLRAQPAGTRMRLYTRSPTSCGAILRIEQSLGGLHAICTRRFKTLYASRVHRENALQTGSGKRASLGVR